MVIPQRLYNKIKSQLPIVCVDIVVLHNQHVLFLKRANDPLKGQWFFPGGRLYKDETLEQCAIRKAREECGLRPLLGPLVHFESTIYPNIHTINFCFLMISMQHDVTLDNTSTDYTWIFYEDVEEYIADDYIRNCLRGASLID